MKLRPVSYKMKDGDSGRIHMGLYAYDVAYATNATVGDLLLYEATVVNEDGTQGYYDDAVDDSKLSWSLKYEELIAPTIAMVQKQKHYIKQLEERIDVLESK